jgi:hypothetical protein
MVHTPDSVCVDASFIDLISSCNVLSCVCNCSISFLSALFEGGGDEIDCRATGGLLTRFGGGADVSGDCAGGDTGVNDCIHELSVASSFPKLVDRAND